MNFELQTSNAVDASLFHHVAVFLPAAGCIYIDLLDASATAGADFGGLHGPHSTTSICCGFIVQLIVQHVVRQIHNKSKQMECGFIGSQATGDTNQAVFLYRNFPPVLSGRTSPHFGQAVLVSKPRVYMNNTSRIVLSGSGTAGSLLIQIH